MSIFFHVTPQRGVKRILQKGILSSHKHNVPLSKQVVYVMNNKLDAGIFASKMRWEMETPVSVISLNINKRTIRQDKNTGAYGSWKEYHGDISPKAIIKVESADEKFWKEHQKRMSKVFKR
jgi:hypothetical protein